MSVRKENYKEGAIASRSPLEQMMNKVVPDYNAPIVAGTSLGGIELGGFADEVLACLQDSCRVENTESEGPAGAFTLYELDGGVVGFGVDGDGVIVSLWCRQPYQGLYDGRLGPGMSVSEISKMSRRQFEFGGYLVLDRNYQVYFGLPALFDDFDSFDELPRDLVFEELYVGDLMR